MRAAIYARKSNEQKGVKTKQKSVTRQSEGARKFIAEQGWTLDDTQIGTKQVKGPDGKVEDAPVYRHIYEDDGVSGAVFANRPEFQRMLRDAEAGAFDAIVFFDQDRFGRDARRAQEAIYKLSDLGISVWDYSRGRAIDLRSMEGRIMMSLSTEIAQEMREKGRKHTRDSHRHKAEQGLVTGGRCFGYTNVRRSKGETLRVQNPAEAAVVRDIFTRYAAGDGAFTIAAALNAIGASSPRAQQGRPNGWSDTTVRDVLDRPLYRGILVWGRTSSRYGPKLGKAATTKRGTLREKAQLMQPEDEWIRLPVNEALRIVDPALAARVDARRRDRRSTYLANLAAGTGRAPEKAHGKYLLTGGMLICPTCGGHFEGLKGRGVYVCATHRRKPGCCANRLALSMPYADDVVLTMLEDNVLSTTFIEELLSLVDQGVVDDTARVTAERDRLRGEVKNLTESIAVGQKPASIVEAIGKREQEIERLNAKLRLPKRVAPKVAKLRAALEQRAAEWKATLRAEPKLARLLIRRLIDPLLLPEDSPRPDFIEAVADVKPGLLDGLHDVGFQTARSGGRRETTSC